MNNNIAAVAAESLQSFQKCEAFRNQLLAEIEKDRLELKKISEVKKYTSESKKKMARLEEKIKDKLNNLEDVQAMLKFQPGNWVRNGTTRPGKIIELKIAGRIPEVHVLWWNNTAAVPERPRLLKIIEPAGLEYVWDAQQFPKLIRRIDRFECEDLQVLQKEYESALDSKKITYCRKRFNYLTQEKFPSGIRVQLGSLLGTTLKYPDSSPKSLIQVPLTLDADESGKHFVKRAVSPVELINLGYQDHLQPKKKQLDKILDFCNQKPEVKNIPIDQIKRDGGTQQRVALNHEIVIEYAEAMENGARFPPVKLKYDGENYWLTDGFHTTEAAWSIGKTEIAAEVTPGTLREAILDSVAVNANHGLRRTNADKRRAVTTLLEDEEWKQWSDREIARRCKVSNRFVSNLRKNLTVNVHSHNLKTYKDRYGNISQMNTENIGKQEQIPECLKNSPEDLTGEIPTDNPKDDKKIITVNVHSDNPKTPKDDYEKVSQINIEEKTVFSIGDLVKIQLANLKECSPQEQICNHRYAKVIATTDSVNAYEVKPLGYSPLTLFAHDLKLVDEPTLSINFTPKQFIKLLDKYENRYAIEKALKDGVFK